MARLARVVVPGYPHHVTQRGNRRLPTFFSDDDYEAYLALMAEQCADRGVAIRAWCLMPNHVHLVAVPETAEALARAVGEAHRRYTRGIPGTQYHFLLDPLAGGGTLRPWHGSRASSFPDIRTTSPSAATAGCPPSSPMRTTRRTSP